MSKHFSLRSLLSRASHERGVMGGARPLDSSPRTRPRDRFLASGVFDREFYEAVTRRTFESDQLAAEHLLSSRPAGPRPRPSPHPFISMSWLPRPVTDAWNAGQPIPLVNFLRTGRSLRSALGPLFDPRTLEGEEAGPSNAIEALGMLRGTAPLPVAEGFPADAPSAQEARSRLLQFLRTPTDRISWDDESGPRRPPPATGGPGSVSVIVTATHAPRRVLRNVFTTLDDPGVEQIEVIVVVLGEDLQLQLDLVTGLMFVPGASVLVTDRTSPAEVRNMGAAAASNELLVFLDDDVDVAPGWPAILVRELDDEGVLGCQPVLLHADHTIHSAGIGFRAPNDVGPLLAGHPPEDRELAAGLAVPAVSGAACAVRAVDFKKVGGFDPAYAEDRWDVDLCLRLSEVRGGRFTVAPGAPLTKRRPSPADPADDRLLQERWATSLAATPVTPVPRVPAWHVAAAAPQLRWGLRIASTPGPYGDKWGDTHFAASLAGALRGLGQHVVTYRRGLHGGPGTELDDVVLAIRGLERVQPLPGKVNVLWVISHPREVTCEELQGFDLVYAASDDWSLAMTRTCGRPVEPLLQATEVDDLRVLDTAVGDGRTAVFVGSALNRRRDIVHDALDAGIDVAVYGPGWRGLIPDAAYRGEYLPNQLVPTTYREHGLVLADHWHDMAAAGFVANRVFDAIAVGARVISDPVPGITELFRGAVQTYSSSAELRALATSPHSFPSQEKLREIALLTRRQDTFTARAAKLLDDVAVVIQAARGT